MSRAVIAGIALLAALVAAAPAAGEPRLVPVGDFDTPVHVASPPGDPDLYVVEKRGRVVLLDGAARHVFLDARATTEDTGEQGLLSIAFPPDHASSGLFYVFQAIADVPADGDADRLGVVEYRRDPANPLRALPESRRIALSIPHDEQNNHDGGQLQFGPDGALWVSVGDGGEQGDPQRDSRNTASLLGKLLRIDPATGAPAAGSPFPGSPVAHYGLRNPFRFSFDRQTGDLVLADVGGSVAEEVSFLPAGSPLGRDFGWNCVEGTFHHVSRPECATVPPHVAPVIEHRHADGSWSSVIGGYVVRDPQVPSLLGRYVYGDIAHPWVRSARLSPGAAEGDGDTALAVSTVYSFGEDACGRVYVAEAGGTVSRIEENQPSSCVPGPGPGPGPQPPPAADTTPCALTLRAGSQRLRRHRPRLRLFVLSDEACRVTVAARVKRVARFRARMLSVAAGQRTAVRLRAGRRALRRLRRAQRRRGSLRVRVRVRGVDGAGNPSAATRKMRLRRPR